MWVLAIATRKLNDVQIVMLLSIRAPHRPCLLAPILTLTLTCCSVYVRRKALACAQPGPRVCGASPQCWAWHGTAYRRLQQHCAELPTAAYRRTQQHCAKSCHLTHLRPSPPPHSLLPPTLALTRSGDPQP